MLKVLLCVDCHSQFAYEARSGPPRTRCTECFAAHERARARIRTRRWREANPERQRESSVRSRERKKLDPAYREKRNASAMRYAYGISMDEYEAMLEAQGGVCAICKGPHRGVGKRLHVDHCHVSGKVRGLLCGNCNTFIGLAEHDPDRLRQAIAYLAV